MSGPSAEQCQNVRDMIKRCLSCGIKRDSCSMILNIPPELWYLPMLPIVRHRRAHTSRQKEPGRTFPFQKIPSVPTSIGVRCSGDLNQEIPVPPRREELLVPRFDRIHNLKVKIPKQLPPTNQVSKNKAQTLNKCTPSSPKKTERTSK